MADMMKVQTGDLVPGMKTGRDVRSVTGKLLLAAGTVLTAIHIESLERWEIGFAYVDMGLLPPDSFHPLVSPVTREKAVGELRGLLARSQHSAHLQRTPQMEQAVTGLVDDVLHHQSSIVNLSEIRQYDEYLLSHSLGVCLLCVMTGANLGWDRSALVLLGLAGLLHDVGKVRIPPAILMKPGPLDPEEWVEVRKHPLHALDILHEDPCIMEAASQHHENMDGSGYPHGLQNGAIGEFARIVAIADIYDAMTTDRVYRPAIPVNEVLELIYASGGGRFDVRFVHSFLYGIAAYPLGSVVEVSDASLGVVVENFPGMPLYPRVRILRDAGGRAAAPPLEIALGDCGFTIRRQLNPAESFALSQSLGVAP